MTKPRLTYCGNVHPAADLDDWLRVVAEFAAPIGTSRRRAGRPFGLGVWWNAALAAELTRDAGARRRLAAGLAAHDLELWTANVFPLGDFHGERVKTAVYSPDWASEARVLYTQQVAELAAQLAPPGSVVPLSTLPLGFETGDLRQMAGNLVRVASYLADLEARHGRELVLALEPEPNCLCETSAATADFLESWVFRPGAWPVEQRLLRRHIGICLDLCHLAVVGEDPIAACEALRQRQIRLPKVQVSACLELRDPNRLDDLLAFDESRYLHQTVASTGARALDLDQVAERRAEFEQAARLRTHFHVPVFWDDPGALGSSRTELQRVLPVLGQDATVLFEVETYTWGVLGSAWGDLRLGLEKELEFTDSLLSAN